MRSGPFTPEGLHGLLFLGPESKRLANALIFGLLWERDRLTMSEVEDVHLRGIHDCLMSVREAMRTNCKVMLLKRKLRRSFPEQPTHDSLADRPLSDALGTDGNRRRRGWGQGSLESRHRLRDD